ncbi:MAG: GntR family transcriptional regulator [Spirochaetaceae bacterium]|nr:GntR family transcriptional regulator [Spirochaetaceae bacterium]
MGSTLMRGQIEFSLDAGSGVPVYRQIIKHIENAVLSGRVKAGDQLPTIRALATELKLNPNTIAKAYNELEIRGVVLTQAGSGTFISGKCPEFNEGEHSKKVFETVERFLREMNELGFDRCAVVDLLEKQPGNEN